MSEFKERPIIFSGPMVRAILEGRKSQTRRIIKPQHRAKCPYGKKGDRLWVRETWRRPVYRATDPDGCDEWRWRPAIHMPRWASRITLKITGVRVERLQEISEQDAIAEGVDSIEGRSPKYARVVSRHYGGYVPASESFQNIWKSIHGPESWEQNPWVWVVEFKKEAKNGR